eukprot:9045849-Pyramimonas_sp.AAC.1
MGNLAPSSAVECKRHARRTSWRQTDQGWLDAPRGLSCVREERLERREVGSALKVAEGGVLERLLVPLQDGGVGLSLDVEARDGRGVAMDLALGSVGSPRLLRMPVLKELEKFLALDFGANLLRRLARVEKDVRWRAR